jgi:hypothetical protein
MGYLDGDTVTVDAVLTKKGREILGKGGSLNITSFTLSDTGVDYTLWNTAHPSGSANYGEAIENLPMLEAGVHAQDHHRNRLITLNQDTIAIPAIEVSAPGLATSTNTLTFDDTHINGITVSITPKGFASNQMGEIYLVLADPIFSVDAQFRKDLSGTTHTFYRELGYPTDKEYVIKNRDKNGTYHAHFTPNIQKKIGLQTSVLFVMPSIGAYNFITLKNNVEDKKRRTLPGSITKG